MARGLQRRPVLLCGTAPRDFLDEFTFTCTDFDTETTTTGIEWTQAALALDHGRLACSSGEAQLLRIAASLVQGIPVDLRDAIASLDALNTALVTQSLARASGH